MVKRYLDLLLPQKKLFGFADPGSVLLTILGIASSMFNKILMDEVLPYGLKSLLIDLDIGVQHGKHHKHADRLCTAIGP